MKNEVAIVTGGCQGLGKEIALALSTDYQVAILSNNQTELDKTCEIVGCDKYFCDITDFSGIKKTISDIENKYGRIDVLVNNAGVWVSGELDDNDYSDIAKVVLVNVVGTMSITKAVLPIMKRQNSGKIVNVISVDGLEGKAERSIYCSSKFAITGFTESLKKEVNQYGISVSGVYPGLMKTNLFKNAGVDRNLEGALDPKNVAQVIKFSLTTGDTVLDKIVLKNLQA